MRRSGNKVVAIVLIIIAILAIAGGVFAYTFFATDMFKSGQQLFAKYLVQNLSELTQTVPIDKITNIENKLEQSKYEESMTVSYTESGEVQPANLITMDTQVDPIDRKTYTSVALTTEEIEEELKVEFMQNLDTYSLRFSNSVKQFLSIENNGLKQLLTNMGMDEEIIEVIPDSIDFEQFSLEKLELTEQEKNAEISKYAMVLYNNIPKENYAKNKNSVITVNGKTITTNAYVLTLNAQDIKNLLTKFLETLKQDEIVLSKLQIVDEMLQEYEMESIKEAFTEGIDSILNDIANEENIEESAQDTNIKIIIYEENGKTVRIKLEHDLEYATIDTIEVDGKKQIDLNYVSIDEENTQLSNGMKIIRENDNKLTIQVNDVWGEEQITTNYSVELIENGNNTKITYMQEDEDGQILIIRDINFLEQIDYKVTLDSSNNILLNELSEEQMTNIFNALEPTLTTEYLEPMELVDTPALLPVLLAIPMEFGDIPALIPVVIGINVYNTASEIIEETDLGYSEAEIAMFNSAFLSYEGSLVSTNTINALLNTVLTHNLSQTYSETENYVTVSGDIVLGADDTSFTKVEGSKYYDVECKMDEEGRVNEIIITEPGSNSNSETLTPEEISPDNITESRDDIVNMGENIINALNSLN